MAAAVTLAWKGVPVTVFEASRSLGGRARRVEIEGTQLDNGQHILIGAYRETLELMRKVGVDPDEALLRLPLEIRYSDGFRLRAPRLPYPFNLAAAFLTANGLGLKDGMEAARFMQALAATSFVVAPDRPVAQWLDEHGQRGEIRARLWEPLCVSALNTPVETASAQVFARVLRDGLTGSREASDLLLARSDLGKLFPEPAAEFVRSRRGDVRLGAPVRALAMEGSELVVDAESAPFAAVIVACGPQHAASLLSCFPEAAPAAALISALEYEPIVTCYLKYPESVSLPSPMLGFRGGHAQWMFDRGQLDGQKGLIAAVISASGPHEALSREELAGALDAELRAALPALPAMKWSRVIAEKRATFSCRPSVARPEAKTAVPGLYLAGDYVASEYPGTLEAAVRSGIAAAALVDP
jgi:squalene-associated FAD-dependent desaturase